MRKRIMKTKHSKNKVTSLPDNILREIKEAREEVKSLQKSLANHREDTAVNVIVLSGLLKRILENQI